MKAKDARMTRITYSFNPVTRIVKSKKTYTRKNKSWKKEIE